MTGITHLWDGFGSLRIQGDGIQAAAVGGIDIVGYRIAKIFAPLHGHRGNNLLFTGVVTFINNLI
jgi:hypothetical protein